MSHQSQQHIVIQIRELVDLLPQGCRCLVVEHLVLMAIFVLDDRVPTVFLIKEVGSLIVGMAPFVGAREGRTLVVARRAPPGARSLMIRLNLTPMGRDEYRPIGVKVSTDELDKRGRL